MKIFLNEEQFQNLVHSQIEEDYPFNWNIEEFKKLRSFNKRIKYCQANLKRISSGSSRIVYMIDDTRVLKLAKNIKGIEQNGIEGDWKDDGYYEDILARVFELDPDDLWIEMELARKVTPNIFKGIHQFSFLEFSRYISAEVKYNGDMKEKFFQSLKDRELLDNSEFVMRIINFINDNDAPVGDFIRLSSYGLVKRDGDDKVVLIDFGITGGIYNSYYS